jgi:hypothetical protein
MYLTGNDIKVYTGATPLLFGHAKGCSIVVGADVHESASVTNGKARTYLVGRTDWEVTVGKFVAYMRHDLLHIGQTVTLTIGVDNTDKVTGTAYITQVTLAVQGGNLVQCSVRFKGTGALS